MGKSRIRRRRHAVSVSLVAAGAVIGGGLLVLSAPGPADARGPAYADTATNCRVVDGDTLHCDGGRIRLLGIDAPELPGHCAVGRDCAPGDPYESTRSLSDGLGDGARVRVENAGTDRYGRTLAMVMGRRGDLSCWQLQHHAAIYKPRWDNDGRVAALCPSAAR